MSELYDKSIRTLELPAVLEVLAQKAVSEAARERCRKLYPSSDLDEVRRLLDETDAARTRLGLYGSPAFSGVKDVSAALTRADHGGMLNTRELLDIAGLLTNVRRVQDYYKEDEEGTVIDKLFLSLHPNRFLEEKITTAILDENEIAERLNEAGHNVWNYVVANSSVNWENLLKQNALSAYQIEKLKAASLEEAYMLFQNNGSIGRMSGVDFNSNTIVPEKEIRMKSLARNAVRILSRAGFLYAGF